MKKETLLVLIISIVVLFLINLPIIYFYLFPKENLVFLGRRSINSQDTYTYIALIEQAKQGKAFFTNLFTNEYQTASLIRPAYFMIGKIAALLNISSILAFHLSRLILSFIFLAVLYRFIRRFFDSVKQRIFVFILLLTSSGLGFILGRIVPDSSDLWIPESITFLSLAESPHFIFSQILMLSGLMFFLKYLKKRQLIDILTSTCLFLLLSFEHPYNLLIIGTTVLFISLLTGEKIYKSIFFAFLSSFGLIYQIVSQFTNPTLKSWYVQHLSPPPIAYLVGFGLLIPFAIIGMEKVIREKNITYKLLLVWFFVTGVMLYFPFEMQRRTVEGIHTPLAILAGIGLFSFADKFKKHWLDITIGAIFLLSLSSLYSIYTDFSTIKKDSVKNYYYYITKPEAKGIGWLKSHTNDNDVILSNWFYGNLIPGLTGRTVYLGHKAQTIDFEQKISLINNFLLSSDTKLSLSFLEANKIKYIFLGNNDSMLSYGFKPDSKPFLTKIYSENGVLIYKVSLK